MSNDALLKENLSILPKIYKGKKRLHFPFHMLENAHSLTDSDSVHDTARKHKNAILITWEV